MAITLGTFTKFDDGVFAGTLKTLLVTAPIRIIPVDKMSDNAPDHRVYEVAPVSWTPDYLGSRSP
jgi:uncharacterized protein (DUF736 family)